MTVHVWWCEIDDRHDMMRCGFVVSFGVDSDIANHGHDFLMGDGERRASCVTCLAALRNSAARSLECVR